MFILTDAFQNDHFRGYKGDFYAAALLAQDLSNPLLANAKILNIVSKANSHYSLLYCITVYSLG